MEEKTCFMIMPITTHKEHVEEYKNDNDHFVHVMDCLFKPAIEMAGFTPVVPIAEGSELIHADIISKLESSDLVLCDMSKLNPNVFFELGIRTALNKPVCLVKDDITTKIPFDTSTTNHHTYKSDLSSWIVKPEIEKLSNHIKKSYERNSDTNTLWKYFGLKNTALPIETNSENDMLSLISMQLEGTMSQLQNIENSMNYNRKNTKKLIYGQQGLDEIECVEVNPEIHYEFLKHRTNYVMVNINRIAEKYSLKIFHTEMDSSEIKVTFNKNIPKGFLTELEEELGPASFEVLANFENKKVAYILFKN